jgi:uncharacterized protein (TIGR03643 family)
MLILPHRPWADCLTQNHRFQNTTKTNPLSTTTHMDQKDIDRIIEMAWEDRTPFEAIHFQFGLTEAQVIATMRKELKRSSFNLWRKRVNSGVSQKHAVIRNQSISRFKCKLQKTISMNKISKR